MSLASVISAKSSGCVVYGGSGRGGCCVDGGGGSEGLSMSSPNTVLKCLNKSSAVKFSDCVDFDQNFRFIAFQNFRGCFLAIAHIFSPSFIL